MFKRIFQLSLVAGLVVGALWAANDPFVGEWKLNPSRSKLTDQMKVRSIATNKYVFDFGDGGAETIAADGTDHFTAIEPNGSTFNLNYVYKRTAGGPGFAGTWESTSETVNSVFVLQIRPYEGDGLSFIDPSEEETKNVKFDGKDHANVGPNVAPDSASSIRRMNKHTLEMTDKINGKIVDTQQIKLSSDLKTLTITVHTLGRSEPNILVFERHERIASQRRSLLVGL